MKKTIYAVVRYPAKWTGNYFHFNLYTKQTSNLEIMNEYHKDIQSKFPEPHWRVVLVPRETAKKMQRIWSNYHRGAVIRKLPRKRVR